MCWQVLRAISANQDSVQPFAVDAAAVGEQGDADEERPLQGNGAAASSDGSCGPSVEAQLIFDVFLKRPPPEDAKDDVEQPAPKKAKLDVARPLRGCVPQIAEDKVSVNSENAGDLVKVEKLCVVKAAKQSYIQAVCNGRKRLLVSVTPSMSEKHEAVIAQLLALAEPLHKSLLFRDLKQLLLEARTKLL